MIYGIWPAKAELLFLSFSRWQLVSTSGCKDIVSNSTFNNILEVPQDIFHISAILYRLVMEEMTNSAYKNLSSKHVDGKRKNCGMFVGRCNKFWGASPDLLASCSCCREGVMEIKCPYICRGVSTLIKPPSFLEVNNAMRLKTSRSYYAQIQGPMGVTGRKWCDFLLFQKKDIFYEFYLIKRIGFC